MIATTVAALLTAATLQPDFSTSQPTDGAWNHAVHVATSTDGRAWVERDTPVRIRSTSPDVLVLSGKGDAGEAGIIALYTLDMLSGGNLAMSRWLAVDEGKRWFATPGVTIEGDWGGAVRNISVTQLDDGRIRIYVVIALPQKPAPRETHPTDPSPRPTPPGPPGRPRPVQPPTLPLDPAKEDTHTLSLIRSAISTDGLKFTIEEGNRHEAEGITAADVAWTGKHWLLVFSRANAIHAATSDDGLTFTDQPALTWEAATDPSILIKPDGAAKLLAATPTGIRAADIDLKTHTLRIDQGTLIPGPAGHPTAAILHSGTHILLLTRFLDGRDPRW